MTTGGTSVSMKTRYSAMNKQEAPMMLGDQVHRHQLFLLEEIVESSLSTLADVYNYAYHTIFNDLTH